MYLSLLLQQQHLSQHSYATSDEPWTLNQILLKCKRWIKKKTSLFVCGGAMFYYWPCPIVFRTWSMPLGMIIFLGSSSTNLTDCGSTGRIVYLYILCDIVNLLHISDNIVDVNCTWEVIKHKIWRDYILKLKINLRSQNKSWMHK